VLRKVHQPPRLDTVEVPRLAQSEYHIGSGGFRAQSISDAVVLSADAEPWGLYHICYSISELAVNLLKQGIFIRGAITKGKLYHDDKTVFGEGLVRAFDFESRIARFPRVVVTTDVVQDINAASQNFPHDSNFKDILKQADDGPMYLNVLHDICTSLKFALYGEPPTGFTAEAFFAHVKQVRDKIQGEFDTSFDDPTIFEKLQWFARYWNHTLPDGIIEAIHGPAVAKSAFQ
jgi:hypothetical protein